MTWGMMSERRHGGASRRVQIALVMTGVFLVLMAAHVTAPATAVTSPSVAGPGEPALVPGPSGPRIGSSAGGSDAVLYYNWSGYAATSSEPFLAVQSTYVQPVVTCPVAGAYTVFWVGFDGFQNGTVEQAGTAAYCPTAKGEPSYYAWWEMYPTNYITSMPLTIRPGDTIHAKVTYNSSTASYTMTVTDSTTKQHYAEVAHCAQNLTCARASAEWIVERPTVGNNYTPLADWGTMRLKGDKAANRTAIVNGKQSTKPVYQPVSGFVNNAIDMIDESYTGRYLATVGNLNGTGTVFADTWLAAE
jgi:hypothetical protein